MHIGFYLGNLKKRHHLEVSGVYERSDVRAWTGLIWLRTRVYGGLLLKR
jgi:hypothetical protein